MTNKTIGFFGNFENAFLDILEKHNVCFVIFEMHKENNNIIEQCNLHHISYYSVSNRSEIKKILKSFKNISLLIVASFGLIFDKEILDFPNDTVINIHPGVLPMYRGRHPLPQAILNKDTFMGITAHVMNIKIDQGSILKISKTEIEYDKDYRYNEQKLLKLLSTFVLSSIQNFYKNTIITTNGKECYYKPLDKKELHLICNIEQLENI